ncbi:unnamed protein product [Lepidochelys olivacea]
MGLIPKDSSMGPLDPGSLSTCRSVKRWLYHSRFLWHTHKQIPGSFRASVCSDPVGGVTMKKTVKDSLLWTLNDLTDRELKTFKFHLKTMPVKKPYENIPWGTLENTDRIDLTNLLVSYYQEDYAVDVTVEVLKTINKRDLEQRLTNTRKAAPAENIQSSNINLGQEGLNSSGRKPETSRCLPCCWCWCVYCWCKKCMMKHEPTETLPARQVTMVQLETPQVPDTSTICLQIPQTCFAAQSAWNHEGSSDQKLQVSTQPTPEPWWKDGLHREYGSETQPHPKAEGEDDVNLGKEKSKIQPAPESGDGDRVYQQQTLGNQSSPKPRNKYDFTQKQELEPQPVPKELERNLSEEVRRVFEKVLSELKVSWKQNTQAE